MDFYDLPLWLEAFIKASAGIMAFLIIIKTGLHIAIQYLDLEDRLNKRNDKDKYAPERPAKKN